MSRRRRPVLDRILEKVDVGDCWLFTGAISRYGYGVIHISREQGTRHVHLALWNLLVGPVPDGLELDHQCRVRHCCNPDHLEPVPRQVNVDRGRHAAGRPRSPACPTCGGPYTQTRFQRVCRPCEARRNREYRARRKAAA